MKNRTIAVSLVEGFLDKIRKDPRVDSVSDETDTDDGYFVFLKDGYVDNKFDPLQPTSVIHEWDLKSILDRLDGVVKI